MIRVFTTRPDTLFGATYMVLAPEHPLVDRLTTPEQRDGGRRPTGEAAAARATSTGPTWPRRRPASSPARYAINPVNGEPIPIWIADYVLMGYGTGAIMAVPGHDERDFEFATAVRPADRPRRRQRRPTRPSAPLEAAETDAGRRGQLAQRRSPPRRPADRRGQGRDHRLAGGARAWAARRSTTSSATGSSAASATGASRSRSCSTSDGSIQAVAESELPVLLPELDDFNPSGKPEPPLGKATEWVRYSDAYRRETNTMPQWAGLVLVLPALSSTRRTTERPCDPELEKYWMPVDLYVGGAEHAVLHLLYSRFWHKVLFDRGHVSTPEPFQRLVNQGMILGEMEYTAYQDDARALGLRRDGRGAGRRLLRSRRAARTGRSSR